MSIIDPIIREIDLQKLSHNFAVGDRVRVKESGHRGKITQFVNGKIHVLLDSHHSVNVNADEVEPFDFPSSRESAPERMSRAYDAGDLDPIIRSGGVLQKKAPPFRIGQAVKVHGREGTVIDVRPSGLVEIRYSPNISGLCVASDVQAI